ncbi:Carboxypeptidase [Thalictrum thalictroides]|uniref:Carboxypeptidase n=1 Tax=Thalictrum thalictroides TaxID=46969 RepID=A0A7J6UUI1_THATH|nr:Carboxypeptidase [Thalictrum thalictroides]
MLSRDDFKLLDAEWAISYNDIISIEDDEGSQESDLIRDYLPGQPSQIDFKHYAGYVTVDKLKGRSLFYYFVESAVPDPLSKPVVLWLNGGPGCSSIGIGAFAEHGPFGVRSDGTSLYLRRHSWNKVANILYLESPAGVGFSYSNTTSDYNTTGDLRTAQDSYVFLINWFKRFSQFKNNDFYIAGESYAGFYIPELADLIIHNNLHAHSSSPIKLTGVMVGNGLIDYNIDRKGLYLYLWSHGLISVQTYEGLIKTCVDDIKLECISYGVDLAKEVGNINMESLYSEGCLSIIHKHGSVDPCEKNYVIPYLNQIQVQKALHASRTQSPYSWSLCSFGVNMHWRDMPSSMLPLYRRLIAAGVRILVYSGDWDGVLPFTGTKLAIDSMNLTIRSRLKPWLDDQQQVAGYRVDYEGLTFATVLGAGHEVPRFKPKNAFILAKSFLEGM